jgi:DNA repair protein RadC
MRIYQAKISYQLVQDGPAPTLVHATSVVEYLRSGFEELPLQEMVYVIFLSRKNKALGRHLVTIGTLTAALCAPREVFRPAILASASSIVVAHNHPSGDPSPSAADLEITRALRSAGEVIGIPLMDHVIAGNIIDDPMGRGYYSFREAGIL